MKRRLMNGVMDSDGLIRDLRQPSGRIAGKAAMVVMVNVKSRKSESSFGWAGPAEFPPSLKFARSGCRQRDSFSPAKHSSFDLFLSVIFWRDNIPEDWSLLFYFAFIYKEFPASKQWRKTPLAGSSARAPPARYANPC
jgi:hypothetical protein